MHSPLGPYATESSPFDRTDTNSKCAFGERPSPNLHLSIVVLTLPAQYLRALRTGLRADELSTARTLIHHKAVCVRVTLSIVR